MEEQIPFTTPHQADTDVATSIERLANKIKLIAEAVKTLHQERLAQETKIEDAQKRIQHILSRLPDQSDTRQMNLLGDAATPTTPEDDNEPTTH
ncbi:hypothetical protein TUM22923_04180 [Polynucleobacter sp. TUM22923]|jgi:division protein CdvB (Snf7/Vps24/ESCRT-III family)|uniref:hypothetical protein n=1 Tax=Polynucleobacter sp. TUM22923 TaxID=3022126 RepID=UPI00257318D1|nr:hypothetical protein [Polynucleobacter sp. TUM22923]BDX21097.1 hypothetical protein TUM22923_04180 [Polynucleobacter sp. TUM22923]